MTLQTIIDGKKVLSEISSGGHAIVYKVWDEVLETHYAIKVMKRSAADNADRFLTEAKVLAQLRHRNIPTILGYGKTDDNRPFIRMEFVDGKDIGSLIKEKGKLPPSVALSIIIQVARALQYAHNLVYEIYGEKRKGLIHRDIKPANILVGKDGVVKLIDFGIAKIDKLSIHTSATSILGTPHYMAPEQLDPPDDDPKLDNRGDIYSLGCVLYECITGKCQFDAETITGILSRKQSGKYDMSGLNEFSPLTKKIITTATAIEKKSRYVDISQMIEDLEDALANSCSINRVEDGIKNFIETGEFHVIRDKKPLKKRWIIFPLLILTFSVFLSWKLYIPKTGNNLKVESIVKFDTAVSTTEKTVITDSTIIDKTQKKETLSKTSLKVLKKRTQQVTDETSGLGSQEVISSFEMFKKGLYSDVVMQFSGKKSAELSDSSFLILCGSLLNENPEKLGEYLFSRTVRDGYHHYLRGRFYCLSGKWEQARSSFLKTLTVPTIIPCDEENQFYLVNSAFYLYTKSPNISNRDFFKGQKNEYLIKYCSKHRKSKNCTAVEKMDESKNIF
ncbi:MAG: serine/threonine protein kinase [Spirochaetes bacterium]|nr:serine/threonine protein kinase [Spirochaetota bacterium]